MIIFYFFRTKVSEEQFTWLSRMACRTAKTAFAGGDLNNKSELIYILVTNTYSHLHFLHGQKRTRKPRTCVSCILCKIIIMIIIHQSVISKFRISSCLWLYLYTRRAAIFPTVSIITHTGSSSCLFSKCRANVSHRSLFAFSGNSRVYEYVAKPVARGFFFLKCSCPCEEDTTKYSHIV